MAHPFDREQLDAFVAGTLDEAEVERGLALARGR